MWLPRKPAQSPLTALLPGKVIPGKEAIPLLPNQATLVLRQVTTQFLPRQAVSQAGNTLLQDNMASQEASVVSPYNISSREGSVNSTISQEGSLGNTRSQADNRLTSSRAVRCSTRLRASQADSTIPQVDSKVSLVSSNSSQAVRCSTRCNAPQADSTISKVDSSVSQARRSSSPLPRQLVMLVPRK